MAIKKAVFTKLKPQRETLKIKKQNANAVPHQYVPIFVIAAKFR